MTIFLWVLMGWGISAIVALTFYLLYSTAWIHRYARRYPTVKVCKAALDQDRMQRVLFHLLFFTALPLVIVLHLWRQYDVFLAHQRTIQHLRRQGWDVETHVGPDGLVVKCHQYTTSASEARDVAASAEARIRQDYAEATLICQEEYQENWTDDRTI